MKCCSFYRFCRSFLWLTALLGTALVGALNVAYQTEISYDAFELVSIRKHTFSGMIMIGMLLFFLWFFSKFQKHVEKLDGRTLFGVLSVIYTVMALYLIFNVDNVLRMDAQFVFDGAIAIRNGAYDILQKGQYLYRYPHQLGLTLYMQILSGYSENPEFVFLVNHLLVLVINHTFWKISEELFQDKLAANLTLLLCFAFLPQLFFILFAYGLIPGFCCLALAFYHTLRFVNNKHYVNLTAMLLFIGMAVLLKQNYLIGGIAIALFLFLRMFREKDIRFFAVIVLLGVFMTIPGKIIKAGYEEVAGVELDDGCPSVLWIAMGTDIDNRLRGPGWYDDSSWNIYDASGFDAEKASQQGRQKLSVNWEKMKAEPQQTIRFFWDKMISQWCDPLYQSVWTGPMEQCEQYTYTDFLYSVYNDGVWEDRIAVFSKFLCLAIWLCTAGFLFFRGKTHSGWELMFLYFIGGLVFHQFWEGKSQYIYTYVFSLIPFSACAVGDCMRKLKKTKGGEFDACTESGALHSDSLL